MTNSVTQEYLDSFEEQDQRTEAQLLVSRRVQHQIEADAIRDFDLYIEHSGALLANAETAKVVRQWLGAMLDIEESGLMEDLGFFDDPENGPNGEPTTADILESINRIRDVLGLPRVYIARNYPYAATWHQPGGKWGWAEPRDVLRTVGEPNPTPESITAFLNRHNTGKPYVFCEGSLKDNS